MADNSEICDVIVVGTGPAGISAAVNLKILGADFILFGHSSLSEKVERSELIRNYPGLPEVTGPELNRLFAEHLSAAGVEIRNENVVGIYDMGDYLSVLTDKRSVNAFSVIIASGVQSLKPAKGELEFLGRGVSYCATCDGELYRGKKIAVVCDSPALEHEAVYLSSLAGYMYYFPVMKETSVKESDTLRIAGGTVKEVSGGMKVQSVITSSGESIDVDGVFFLKRSVSPSALMFGLATDEDGHIVVNRDMSASVRGCFAAGDVTGRPYQLAKAAGEGNTAAHSALALAKQRREEQKLQKIERQNT